MECGGRCWEVESTKNGKARERWDSLFLETKKTKLKKLLNMYKIFAAALFATVKN